VTKLALWHNPDSDENPSFAKWWLAWPPQHRIAKGAARREWYRLRPSASLAEQMTQAVIAQAQSQKWKDGYVPRPDRWIKDERWEDFVGEVKPAFQPCQHTPQCPNPVWHQVVLARERGEV